MRAIFTSFDHFMAVFVAAFGVVWSTVFMPLLGGPLHGYEARAIHAGLDSLASGQAANLGEALEIAASIPVDVVLPSAHASEPAPQLVAAVAPPQTELLGGPDSLLSPALEVTASSSRQPPVRARVSTPALALLPDLPQIDVDAVADPVCAEEGCGAQLAPATSV